MSSLANLLNNLRKSATTEREKGTYFEELIVQYLKNEASYQDLYSDVWTYSDWANLQGLDKRDTGIDLVAKTHGTEEFPPYNASFTTTSIVFKSQILIASLLLQAKSRSPIVSSLQQRITGRSMLKTHYKTSSHQSLRLTSTI